MSARALRALLPLAVIFIAAASPAERAQHEFRTGEVIAYHSVVPSRPEVDHPEVLGIGVPTGAAGARTNMIPGKSKWRETVEISDGLVTRVRLEVDRDYTVPTWSPAYHVSRHIVETSTRV